MDKQQSLFDDLGHHLHCKMSQCWEDIIGYCERCGIRFCQRHMPDGRVCWGCKKDEFKALESQQNS